MVEGIFKTRKLKFELNYFLYSLNQIYFKVVSFSNNLIKIHIYCRLYNFYIF